MPLKNKAKEVLRIIDQGGYIDRQGAWVDISNEIAYSITNSKIYSPDSVTSLITKNGELNGKINITVTGETSQVAVKRLYDEGHRDLALLNFASAKRPGGGFLNGAKAQEEDLNRCSTLFACLNNQSEFYENNRNAKSALYTDHAIYSPKVPWFRTNSEDLPNQLYFASVITSPAPNAIHAIDKGESG